MTEKGGARRSLAVFFRLGVDSKFSLLLRDGLHRSAETGMLQSGEIERDGGGRDMQQEAVLLVEVHMGFFLFVFVSE